MNERYLFRGKQEDNGKWVEGDLMQWNDGTMRICVEDGDDSKIARTVIPETVGQCSGVPDKNGTLMYEGDIVESRASENQEDWKKWVVGFSDGGFCFNREIPKKRKHKYEENLLCVNEIELYGLTVIGNIYDNPNLIKIEHDSLCGTETYKAGDEE